MPIARLPTGRVEMQRTLTFRPIAPRSVGLENALPCPLRCPPILDRDGEDLVDGVLSVIDERHGFDGMCLPANREADAWDSLERIDN